MSFILDFRFGSRLSILSCKLSGWSLTKITLPSCRLASNRISVRIWYNLTLQNSNLNVKFILKFLLEWNFMLYSVETSTFNSSKFVRIFNVWTNNYHNHIWYQLQRFLNSFIFIQHIYIGSRNKVSG